jgi:hypothetical protein
VYWIRLHAWLAGWRRNWSGDEPSGRGDFIRNLLQTLERNVPITSFAESISGAVIRHVLLSRQIPDGFECLAMGSPRLQRSVLAGVGTVEEIQAALSRKEFSDGRTLQLLTLSESVVDAGGPLEPGRAELLRIWVSGDDGVVGHPPLLIQLQGVMICVGKDRIAMTGTTERMTAVTAATLEFFWLHAEVQRLEQQIEERWPELDEDTPGAFELSEAMLSSRERLQVRFQQMISAKALLARLAPFIECPVIYPPTLASQAAERLREKSRLGERLQHLREQLEVFERVYELCGQRLSDFISSRRSHLLEWIIIVLLSFELLLMVVDLLGTLTETQ